MGDGGSDIDASAADAGGAPDASDGLDAGVDAGLDAALTGDDSGTEQDSGVDAAPDTDASAAGPDAGVDAGTADAGPDAFVIPDAGRDAGLDAFMSPDAGRDAGLDAFMSPDAGRDAGLDAFVPNDAGVDSGGPPPGCPPRLTVTDDPGATAQTLVLSEIAPGMFIEIYNNTDSAIDLGASAAQICGRPAYVPISTLAGPGVTVPARSYVRLPWSPTLNFGNITNASGELAIYSGNMFGNPTQIIDFVCWGTPRSGFFTRRTEAMTAMKWSGTCAPALTSGAIRRLPDTDGTQASHYDSTATPDGDTCTP